MIAALAPAFADPVHEAQAAFRAAMNAMARPGRVSPLECNLTPPGPLSAEAAAMALTLIDYETLVWLDAPLAATDAVSDWLRFHTGARMTDDPSCADFALISDARSLPDFALFSSGREDYPDRSTTLIVQVESLSSGTTLTLSGPGIERTQLLRVEPLPVDFVERAADNRHQFPRGVDLLFVSKSGVAGLPRSTLVVREG
jgi:alpha-D-ribose 1-methylphosphonate 5-triphosphate synthase subunit PhnH